jgi:hypothetical protein
MMARIEHDRIFEEKCLRSGKEDQKLEGEKAKCTITHQAREAAVTVIAYKQKVIDEAKRRNVPLL